VIERLISGGQTGVDQAGLDFAIRKGIPHGGWVPKGRLSEAGPIPAKYQMKEHLAPTYPPRTLSNVQDSDATVIFLAGSIQDERGCLLTASLCVKEKKPFVVINLKDMDEEEGAKKLREMVEKKQVKILNVAGARGSRKPDVGKVDRILEKGLL
jgi:hypothetical protein